MRNSISFTTLLAVSLAFAACNSASTPNFHQMTEEELFTYNQDRPLARQVFCYEHKDASSWIPRTRCATLEAIVDETARNAARIEVLTPSSGYSVFGSARD